MSETRVRIKKGFVTVKNGLKKLPVLFFPLLGACASNDVSLSMLAQSNQCQQSTESFQLIDSEQTYNALFSDGFSATKKTVPFDLNKVYAVLIAAGQKTTAGYSYSLKQNTVKSIDGSITLPVNFNSPEKGAMTAQVLTSPCIVIGVEKKSLKAINYNDQILTVTGQD